MRPVNLELRLQDDVPNWQILAIENDLEKTARAFVPTAVHSRQVPARSTCFVSLAIVAIPKLGNNVPVIRADFQETYEHSSVLFRNKDLWLELCGRRVEAAKAYLSKSPDSDVMRGFLGKNEEVLKAAA